MSNAHVPVQTGSGGTVTRGPLHIAPVPRHPEEAHTSWWTAAPQLGFTARALSKRERMARSSGAQRVKGELVIAWKVSGQRP